MQRPTATGGVVRQVQRCRRDQAAAAPPHGEQLLPHLQRTGMCVLCVQNVFTNLHITAQSGTVELIIPKLEATLVLTIGIWHWHVPPQPGLFMIISYNTNAL